MIAESPFADLKGGKQENRSRYYFLTREDAQKVLDACPDAQWRLIFALCRFGGLRCPSEVLAIRRDDVDWERSRIRVRSPKTEHHQGKESRQVPIFPELRPYLEEAFEQAEPGTCHVITRYRDKNANLRTQLERIIVRAGLDPWPKLFQNLRSTRETELAREYPIHVVCDWIGNSELVAAKHYLQTTDEDFEKASRYVEDGMPKAVQKAVQTLHDIPRHRSPRKRKTLASPEKGKGCRVVYRCSVPPRGDELSA